MKRTFTARVWREDDQFIAQCAEVDVASYGDSEKAALENLSEALELYFEPPVATVMPKVTQIEVEVAASRAAVSPRPLGEGGESSSRERVRRA